MRCAAVLLVLLVFAAPAQAGFVGQDEAAISENANGLRTRALQAFKDLGATAIRINKLEWHYSDPDAPYAVAQAGLKPQLTLAGSVAYMASVVTQYRDVVNTYGVWNEPDLGVWRCCRAPFLETAGKSKPHRYRSSYPQVYRMIKRLDPTARVMIGELSPHGMGRDLGKAEARVPWFRRVLRRGRPLRADCVAIHPYYWFWSEPMDRQFTRAMEGWKARVAAWAKHRMLLTPRGHRVPICSTEFGEPVQWRHPNQVRRGYRVCKKLKFRQCSQYQIFPSGQRWDTSLTDEFCRPRPEFFQLRKAIRGVPASRPVPWKPCPDAAPYIETPPGPGPYDVYSAD